MCMANGQIGMFIQIALTNPVAVMTTASRRKEGAAGSSGLLGAALLLTQLDHVMAREDTSPRPPLTTDRATHGVLRRPAVASAVARNAQGLTCRREGAPSGRATTVTVSRHLP